MAIEIEDELPHGWALTTLGELVSPGKERFDPATIGKDFPYIGLEHIEKDTGRISGHGMSTEVKSTKAVFHAGDVLYGKLRPYLNKVAIPEFDGVCSTDILVFPRSNHIESMFLYYRLLSRDFVQFANENISGVQHPRTDFQSLSRFRIALPPLAEQRRIVQKVQRLFGQHRIVSDACLLSRKNVLDQVRSMMNAAFEGRLTKAWRENHPVTERASDLLIRIQAERRRRWEDEHLNKLKKQGKPIKGDWKSKYEEPPTHGDEGQIEIPPTWVWVRAEQLSDDVRRGSTPAGEDAPSHTGEVPFIKVNNLTFDGSLDFAKNPFFISRSIHSGDRKNSIVIPGDVLTNITGPPLGKTSIVPDSFAEWNINQAIAAYRPVIVSGEYLCYYLLTQHASSWLLRRAKATAGQYNINLQDCRDLPVPLPPIAEQNAIVEMIGKIRQYGVEISNELEQAYRKNNQLGESILSQAFDGKLVPQDPNDELASVLLERIRAERAKDKGRQAKLA